MLFLRIQHLAKEIFSLLLIACALTFFLYLNQVTTKTVFIESVNSYQLLNRRCQPLLQWSKQQPSTLQQVKYTSWKHTQTFFDFVHQRPQKACQ